MPPLEHEPLGVSLAADALRARSVVEHAPWTVYADRVLLLVAELNGRVRGGGAEPVPLGEIARVRVRAAVSDRAPPREHELERELVVVVVASGPVESHGSAAHDAVIVATPQDVKSAFRE